MRCKEKDYSCFRIWGCELYKAVEIFMEKKNIEAVLDECGIYSFFPKGTSMLPLIRQGRDSVIVEKKNGRLKKYDVALYKRDDGTYVLHRVVRVKRDTYTMCGDHQFVYEHGVREDQVLGAMTELYRDGESFDLNSKEYKRNVRKMVFLQPIRCLVHKLRDR